MAKVEKVSPPSVFLGAWKKTPAGLEARARIIHGLVNPGDRSDLIAQICTASEVRYLIQFLHEEFPQAWKDYQVALTFARAAGLATPENEWPNGKWKELSSDGHTEYEVECQNDHWTCPCVGFGFRRNCRHIDDRKRKILEERNKNGRT